MVALLLHFPCAISVGKWARFRRGFGALLQEKNRRAFAACLHEENGTQGVPDRNA